MEARLGGAKSRYDLEMDSGGRHDTNGRPDRSALTHDWNELNVAPVARFSVDDETLRDGLQGASVKIPSTAEKLQLLHLMESLGMDGADLGMPAAGPNAKADVLALLNEIDRERMRIRPNCAARTLVSDIEPIVELADRAGVSVEVMAFIGSSPIRMYTEGWSLAEMVKSAEEAVGFAVARGLSVCFVTEDTTRSRPDVLQALYGGAVAAGATRVCICDTVGHATPSGAAAVVSHVRTEILDRLGHRDVRLDWHGHDDRGLALANSLAAAAAGADRVHGTALGVGERCGNAATDQLLVNAWLLGLHRGDLRPLRTYCTFAARVLDQPIRPSYPVVGRDAFRTATGIHAAALMKAREKGQTDLVDKIYSGVPASVFGLEQRIEIGPFSGLSNVYACLERFGIDPTRDEALIILEQAKQRRRVLTDGDIAEIVLNLDDRNRYARASAEGEETERS